MKICKANSEKEHSKKEPFSFFEKVTPEKRDTNEKGHLKMTTLKRTILKGTHLNNDKSEIKYFENGHFEQENMK